MRAHIIVRTLPLPQDYEAGDIVIMVDRGKEIRMKVVESALKGEREVKAIPIDRIPH